MELVAGGTSSVIRGSDLVDRACVMRPPEKLSGRFQRAAGLVTSGAWRGVGL